MFRETESLDSVSGLTYENKKKYSTRITYNMWNYFFKFLLKPKIDLNNIFMF